MTFPIVRVRGVTDSSAGATEVLSWPDGLDDFVEVGGSKDDKHAAPAWLPVTLGPAPSDILRRGRVVCAAGQVGRYDECVRLVHALVLDYDVDHLGMGADEVLERWDGFERVVHSTWTPGRWRLVIPYARPMTPEEHARAYAWAGRREGDLIDFACRNPSRLFFWPCVRTDLDIEPVFGYVPGAPLDAVVFDGRQGSAVSSVVSASSGAPPFQAPPPVSPRSDSSAAGERGASPYQGIAHAGQQEDLALIESRCAFMARYRDDVGRAPDDELRLSEPEWYAALSVVSRCRGGDEVALARHRPSDTYGSDYEHREKYRRAKEIGPATCAHVRGISKACVGCPLRVTSPVLLGRADPVAGPEAPDPVDALREAEDALRAAQEAHVRASVASEQARRRMVSLRQAGMLSSEEELEQATRVRIEAEGEARLAEKALKAREREVSRLRASMSAAGLPPGADAATWQRLRLGLDGRPADTLANVLTVLGRDPGWQRRLAFDAFSLDVLLDGETLPETQATEIAAVLSETYALDTTSPRVMECVRASAARAPVHPVRDWLRSLRWDGTPRAGLLALEGFGVDPGRHEKLVRMIGTNLLVGMVARTMRPGCKMDTVVVLTGPQGAFKSTALAALCHDPRWFGSTKIDLGNKDGYLALRGKLLYELAELSSMKQAEAYVTKGWVSNAVDTYRAPYERRAADHPRQTVVVGSDNEGEFLTDPTGSRRFHPLPTRLCRPEWIAEHRDLLFAEAVALYDSGHKWWFDERSEEAEDLRHWSAPFVATHPWTETVAAWLRTVKVSEFSAMDVLVRAMALDPKDATAREQTVVSSILRRLGCERIERSEEVGRVVAMFRRPDGPVVEGKTVVFPRRPLDGRAGTG